MDRRKFLRASGLAAIAAAVSKTTPAGAPAAPEFNVDAAAAATATATAIKAQRNFVSDHVLSFSCTTSGALTYISLPDDSPFTVAR